VGRCSDSNKPGGKGNREKTASVHCLYYWWRLNRDSTGLCKKEAALKMTGNELETSGIAEMPKWGLILGEHGVPTRNTEDDVILNMEPSSQKYSSVYDRSLSSLRKGNIEYRLE